MPNLAQFHPQIVHFVVALLFVGLGLRLVSIFGWPKWVSPAAALLLIGGAIASALAVQSGLDAHGPVERIPGARALVMDHEHHGITARNFFLVVAAIELVALAFLARATTAKYVRYVHIASFLVGFLGIHQLYEAAEHGGELVYSYGAGPGLRTGDPKDVERLLLAGLYNQSQADRKAGRHTQAAELVYTMAKRFPADTMVQLLYAESMLLDSKRTVDALAKIDSIKPDSADARISARYANLKADIHLAMGNREAARNTLAIASKAYPANARLKARLDSLR